MYFCDSFSILDPSKHDFKMKNIGLSLWPITDMKIRSSIRSLSRDFVNNISDFEDKSILALFSYISDNITTDTEDVFNFPVEEFKSVFDKEGFDHPINLSSERGFCFILTGKKARALSRSRCISFLQVVNARPIVGDIAFSMERVFELFPILSQLSYRFGFMAPPNRKTNFLPGNDNFYEVEKSTRSLPTLNWDKQYKLDRWNTEASMIIDNLYISGIDFAKNANKVSRLRITHVINAAAQILPTVPGYETLDLKICDGGDENILSFIFIAAKFIDDCFSKNGSCLVYCQQGVSRSVSLIIGYLMIKEKIDYKDALKRVRERRHVASPNPKFIAQLMQLAEVLGSSPTTSCHFSREKVINFEVKNRKYGVCAVPVNQVPGIKDENSVYISIDFSEAKTLSQWDTGPQGKLNICVGYSASDEFKKCANDMKMGLLHCLRISE